MASLKSQKAKWWIEGRKNFFKKTASLDFRGDIYWFHCASLGEFEQGRPLLEYVKNQSPGCKILLTFFSPSGYQIRKNYLLADFVFYLPDDTPANAKRFLQMTHPKAIFFIKYEFWFNYMRVAAKMNIPFYSVSCIFRKNQFFFSVFGYWFRQQLRYITHFFTQDEYSVKLLQSVDIHNVIKTGDTRFDRVAQLLSDFQPLPEFEILKKCPHVVVAGSTWEEDELLLFHLLKNTDITLVMAPHNIDNQHIKNIKKQFSEFDTIFYSSLSKQPLTEQTRLIVVDSIGVLNRLYAYGSITYVGGAFGKGLHNILEAVVYGKPVIFGTHYRKFKEATDLIRLGVAFSIKNKIELQNIVNQLFNDLSQQKNISQTAQNYILQNTGVCQKIWEAISIKKIKTFF
jgi:3-deoxy-D-manno-octulosonic-acid transferase